MLKNIWLKEQNLITFRYLHLLSKETIYGPKLSNDGFFTIFYLLFNLFVDFTKPTSDTHPRNLRLKKLTHV